MKRALKVGGSWAQSCIHAEKTFSRSRRADSAAANLARRLRVSPAFSLGDPASEQLLKDAAS